MQDRDDGSTAQLVGLHSKFRQAYEARSTAPVPEGPWSAKRKREFNRLKSRPIGRFGVAIAAAAALAVSAASITGLIGSDEKSTEQSDLANVAPGTTVDLGVFVRSANAGDYPVHETLSSAVDASEVAVAGEVLGWAEGPSTVSDGVAWRTALLEVSVNDAVKVATQEQQNVVYVTVSRGGEAVDEAGMPIGNRGTPSTVRSVDELAEAVPVGVRVIVIGNVPSDAVLQSNEVEPIAQGLLLETANGGFGSGVAGTASTESWATHAAAAAGNAASSSNSAGSFENLLFELGQGHPSRSS